MKEIIFWQYFYFAILPSFILPGIYIATALYLGRRIRTKLAKAIAAGMNEETRK